MPTQPKRSSTDKPVRHLNPPSKRERAALAAQHGGKVYGYCRVSTVQQAQEGESLDVQQRTLTGYAQMHGLTLERVFVERGVSGSKPLGDRPQGGELLALLKPGDVVITPRLDRMFRSALDALDILGKLKQGGVALHMIDLGGDTTGNGVSKLVFTILSAVAEAERDRTRERIAEVKQDQKKRGRYLGGVVPFGYRLGQDGALIEEAAQQAAIRRMLKLRQQGLAYRTIAERMNAKGVAISHMGVKSALRAASGRAA